MTEYSATAIDSLHLTPLSVPFSGYYHWQLGSSQDKNKIGQFTTATAYNSGLARSLAFVKDAQLMPLYGTHKIHGFAVRCVAR